MSFLQNCNSPDNFDQVADHLINNLVLVVDHKYYRFLELEFYLYNSEHPDLFCHNNEMQLTLGKWYFHRSTKSANSSYRSGTYKGLDLTFGSNNFKGQKQYGGILIRSLKSLDTGEVIEGPCRCVNHILKDLNIQDIETLASNIDLKITTIDSLYIGSYLNLKQLFYVKGPRVGLSFNRKDFKDASKYIFKDYRYVVVEDIKKDRWSLYLSNFHRNTNLNLSFIRNKNIYTNNYHEGQSLNYEDVKQHLKMKNVKDKCLIYSYIINNLM